LDDTAVSMSLPLWAKAGHICRTTVLRALSEWQTCWYISLLSVLSASSFT